MNLQILNRSKACCINCGKSYKKRENLSKHLVLCDLVQKSKKSKGPIVINDDDEQPILPSANKMFEMLIVLGQKYAKLEEEMAEVKKWVSKKKKKINVLEWLNTNVTPVVTFDNLVSGLIVSSEEARLILDNSFYDTFNQIFSRILYILKEHESPCIFAFDQKVNSFYIYNDGCWAEFSREKMKWFFNKMHMKLVNEFYQWKKVGIHEVVMNKDQFETACDKAIVKLMGIDFRLENVFSKVRGMMFQGLKKDMKALVEYEFEF